MADYRAEAYNDAVEAGIDPEVFIRQIDEESGFNPSAVSPAGAVGIAQIIPQFHPGVDATDPSASLHYAANLMAGYLERYGGDYALALAAYNAGPGAVDKYQGVPPYGETRNYVGSILGDGSSTTSDSGPSASPGPSPDQNAPDRGMTGDPTDNTDQTGGNDPLSWLSGIVGGLFGGGGPAKPPVNAPKPNDLNNPDWAKFYDPASLKSVSTPNGGKIFTVSDAEGNNHYSWTEAAAPKSAYKTLEQTAAEKGFYNPDGTPDTQGYLDSVAASRKSASADKFHVLPNGKVLVEHADGTLSVQDIGDNSKPTTAADRAVNLGNGKYLTWDANGQPVEHQFGGATAPTLTPRSQIVDYLRALLGQQNLPYNGLATVKPTVPGAPPLTGNAPPLAAPPAASPPPVTAPSGGGGSTDLISGDVASTGATPSPSQPAIDLAHIIAAHNSSPLTAPTIAAGGDKQGTPGLLQGAAFFPQTPALH